MSIIKTDEIQARTSGNRVVLPDVNNYPPFRNLIINGDMSIAQRGTSTSSVTTAGYHSVDRFRIGLENSGTFTVSQSTDVPTGQGFLKSFKLACTTADASLASGDINTFEQRLEGQNLVHLKKGTSNAESVTVSFWVKTNKTGTYVFELLDNDNSRHIAKTFTVDSSSTWEKKTLTFSGDTSGTLTYDNSTAMTIRIWLSAGSDFQGGTLPSSWQSATGTNRAVGQTVNLADSTSNEWYITGVQLEVGDSATPFEFLPHDVNLQKCYRYFQEFMSGQSANDLCNGTAHNTADWRGIVQNFVTMRANPTFSSSATSTFILIGNGLAPNPSAISAEALTAKSFCTNITSSMTQGYSYWLRGNSSSSSITLDAEL